VSFGELWTGIDVLDDASLKGTSVVPAQEPLGVKHRIRAGDSKDQEE
jgi:hypothetical protein